jgi:hypothetical protein
LGSLLASLCGRRSRLIMLSGVARRDFDHDLVSMTAPPRPKAEPDQPRLDVEC